MEFALARRSGRLPPPSLRSTSCGSTSGRAGREFRGRAFAAAHSPLGHLRHVPRTESAQQPATAASPGQFDLVADAAPGLNAGYVFGQRLRCRARHRGFGLRHQAIVSGNRDVGKQPIELIKPRPPAPAELSILSCFAPRARAAAQVAHGVGPINSKAAFFLILSRGCFPLCHPIGKGATMRHNGRQIHW